MTYDYTLDIDQLDNFIVKDINGTIVHTNTSIILAIQWMLNTAALTNAKCVVQNLGQRDFDTIQIPTWDTGSDPTRAAMLHLSQGMNLDLTMGLILHETNPANYGLLRLDGRFSGNNQRNGCVIQGVGGRAALIGSGGAGEKGVYIRMGSNIILRNLEIGKTGGPGIAFDADAGGEVPANNDYNTFEDLYIYEWAQGPYSAFGLGIDGCFNTVRRCLMDGKQSGWTRSALYIGAENRRSHDNLIEDCELLNTRYDNGVYLNGWHHAVTNNTFRRIRCAGNLAGGHSGFKFRPSSYNLVEDLLTEGNCYGIDNGTTMTGEESFGDDGVRPYDGWDRGNTFRRAISRNNTIGGLVLTVDSDGKGVEQNYYDILLQNNPLGIWLLNYAGGNGGSGFIQDNTFFMTIEDSMNQGMSISAHDAVNAYTQRNHITGVIRNCAKAINIDDAGVRDNYFDLVIINCGSNPISDAGTRNRFNGIGKFAYGIGVTPIAADWNDGDIIINTSDNTAWYKYAGTVQKLLDGQAIIQFAYMEGKGGLPTGTVQFIDKSFVAARTKASWLWNFGDGMAESTLQHPVHAYTGTGDFNVTLTVTDDLGNPTTTTQTITVGAQEPSSIPTITNAYATPSTPITEGQSVSFNAVVVSALPYTVTWYVDSIAQATGNPASIMFTTPGSYSVDAVATNSAGSSQPSASITITVNAIQVDKLVVDVFADPTSIETGKTSTITVTVAANGLPIQGANVALSASGGTLGLTTGQTDVNGNFTTSFTDSTAETVTISASATKTGYTPSDAHQTTVAITVPPTPEDGLWHTRLYALVQNRTRVASVWGFPLVKRYDEIARKYIRPEVA